MMDMLVTIFYIFVLISIFTGTLYFVIYYEMLAENCCVRKWLDIVSTTFLWVVVLLLITFVTST